MSPVYLATRWNEPVVGYSHMTAIAQWAYERPEPTGYRVYDFWRIYGEQIVLINDEIKAYVEKRVEAAKVRRLCRKCNGVGWNHDCLPGENPNLWYRCSECWGRGAHDATGRAIGALKPHPTPRNPALVEAAKIAAKDFYVPKQTKGLKP